MATKKKLLQAIKGGFRSGRIKTLDNPNPFSAYNQNDYFGYSVSVSDSYVIVGAYLEDDVSGSSGKAYIFNASTGALLHTLDNPSAYDTGASDNFGFSVSISDSYAIVGAYQEDDAGGSNSGKAYIFDPSTGVLLHTLDNPNDYSTSQDDYFGYSVSVSDSYAIVGAFLEDDASGSSSGKAYIFNPSTGSLLHTLDNPNAYSTSASDYFGRNVSISDSYAIVGAYLEDDAGGSSSGKAYIFNPSTGALLHTLDNPNAYSTSANDQFGISVSISDSYAIVGAYQEDDAGGSDSGKAYIFNPSTGALLHTLDNPSAYSTSSGDNFGASVSISDSYAIVGAYLEDDAGGSSSGKAYIFNASTGSLLHTLDNPNAYSTSQDDYFGFSVSISDSCAIVGAYQEDDVLGTSSGKAYVYDSSFNYKYTLNNVTNSQYGGSQDDSFGRSVSISDSYAIVGAHAEDEAGSTSSGKAYIFDPSTGALLHTLDNPNDYSTSANDVFGFSVSISDSYAIVGAYQEDDAGGSDSGKAYIFNPSTGALLHTLDNPNAYGASADDRFGYSASISDSYAIVGAYLEDDAGGSNSGKAYIFNPSTGALLHTLDNPNAYSTSANDLFGISVSISDSYAIVGAYFEDDAGGSSSGKAYIFNPSTGALLHTLDNPNAYSTSLNDRFGFSVSISDSYAIVGAYQEDDASGGNSGKAYIFDPSTGSLLHTLDNPSAYDTGASDNFGYSVSISDTHAIVGAYFEDDAGGSASGKAYIFNASTGSLLHTLDNPSAYSTSSGDLFGRSVSISDSYAIVGAYAEDDAGSTSSGKAYIFR